MKYYDAGFPHQLNVDVKGSFSSILSGLKTDSKYKMKIQPSYEYDSKFFEGKCVEFIFNTPTCLKLNNYNWSMCRKYYIIWTLNLFHLNQLTHVFNVSHKAPSQPYNLKVFETPLPFKDRYDANVSWEISNSSQMGISIFKVILDKEQKNVSGSMNNYVFKNITLSDSCYFTVQAISPAGQSQNTIFYQRSYSQNNHNFYLWTMMLMLFAFFAALAVSRYVCRRRVEDTYKIENTSGYDIAILKGLDDVNLLLEHQDVILSDVFLGQGNFGVVRKGTLKIDGNECPVAVKSLRDHPSNRNLNNFFGEILLMQKVGKHPNIVSIIGCCVDVNKRCMLVVEYCPLGDLQTYLRKVRQTHFSI